MSGVRLVCDSTADLEADFATKHAITVVPLRVIFGEEELRDFVDISPEEFYARMRTDPAHPRTSQPTPAEFEEVFRSAGASGDSIVCTTISAEMSGTFSSATQARAALPDLDIHIVDTRTCGPAHNAAVSLAVARRDAGDAAKNIAASLVALQQHQKLVFTVESLEYLRRGGRIGGGRALLGTVLNIKPILHIENGKVEALDRVRTFPKAIERLFEEAAKAQQEWGDAELVVAHADARERAETMADRGEQITGRRPRIIWVGPVIGCHTGPGAVGLTFHGPVDGI